MDKMPWLKFFTRKRTQETVRVQPVEESYGRMLLLGEAEPPTDFMRNRKLDEALQRYREELRRQRKARRRTA
jgi:hypothetical protein